LETTDEELDAAIAQSRAQGELPRIVEATYYPEPNLDLFVLKISDGRRLVIPRESIQPLAGTTPEEAAEFTTAPLGSHLWWPKLDAGLHLSGLLEHRYGNSQWMARLERREVAA
jgi:hypothetical protein